MLAPSDPHTLQSARDRAAELPNLAYPFENSNMHFYVPWDPKQAETEPAIRNKAGAIGWAPEPSQSSEDRPSELPWTYPTLPSCQCILSLGLTIPLPYIPTLDPQYPAALHLPLCIIRLPASPPRVGVANASYPTDLPWTPAPRRAAADH